MTAPPEGLDWLIALERIKRLRAIYCRSVDSHDWPRMASILTEDFVLDMSQTAEVMGGKIDVVSGKAHVMAMFEQGFSQLGKLLHIVTIPEIEFQDGEHASGVWRQETYVKENRPDLPGTGIAYATVYDTYRKESGRWLIASVRVQLELVF
ncbi:MAG: nuclear transport factor 2 family protein [Novosphingobium sp.]